MTSLLQPVAAPKLPFMHGLAIVLIGAMGGCVLVVLPGVLAAISQERGLTTVDIAYIASAEMIGKGISTLACAAIIATFNRRMLAGLALGGLILANLFSLLIDGYWPLVTARFLAGLSEGTLVAVMAASTAATAAPNRLFALYLTGNLTLSAIFLFILGQLESTGDAHVIFVVFMAASALLLILLRWLPAYPPSGTSAVKSGSSRTSAISTPAMLGLAGTFLIYVAAGASWPIVGRLGLELGIESVVVTRSLSLAGVTGAIAGFLTYLLGDRLGRHVPLTVGAAALGVLMLALPNVVSPFGFGLCVCAFMAFLVIVTPYYTAIVATLDKGGKMASLSVTMQLCGFAVGPLLAAQILTFGISYTYIFAACLTPISIGLMWFMRAHSSKNINSEQ